MKVTSLLIFLILLQLPSKLMAQTQTVTYSGKSVDLKRVFHIIEKQTGYVFLYEQGDLKTARPVSVSLQNETLINALEKIFADQPLEFLIKGRTIFINKKTNPEKKAAPVLKAVAGDGVRGFVHDERDQPLYLVSIVSKALKQGTFSDEKGVFSISGINEPDTLRFTAVGYKTQSVPVTPGEQIRVIMKTEVQKLDEVIVLYNTGYQTLSKERATGSFSKPDMEIVAKRASSMDIIERLDGLVPGLVLTRGLKGAVANTNGNGVSTQKSVLRGIGTILTEQRTDPLYVLNGVIVPDFSSLNTDDIADITVLKDAAALAIYGAKSANGVIVVTTKSGAKQSKPVISYSGFINFQGKPDFAYVPVLNSRQFIQTAKEIFDPVANPYSYYTSSVAPHETILYNLDAHQINQAQADKSLDSLASINNLSQIRNLFYRNSFTNNHTIAASGGNSLYSFYASLGFTQEHSTSPGSSNNTYKLNLSQSFSPGNRVKIDLHTSLINNVAKSNNPVNVGNKFLPYQLFQDTQGNAINMPYMTSYSEDMRLDYQTRGAINLDYYPINETNYVKNATNLLSINVTANATVQLFRGLSFQGTYGYQKAPGTFTSFTDSRTLSKREQLLSFTIPASNPGDSPTYLLPKDGGDYNTGNNDQRNWTVRNQLVYQASPFKGRDHLSLQLGQEVQENYNYRTSSMVMGYNEALGTYARIDYNTLSQGVFGTVTGSSGLLGAPFSIDKSLSRVNSYFALGSYTYDNKYSLDASIRRDHSNLFGSDVSSQNKPIWSVGSKWAISHEEFIKPLTWLNDLALRATYGITGNSPYVGAATQDDVLRGIGSGDVFGATSGDFFTIASFKNRKLEWESTQNINLGLNFAVLHNRLSGSIDFYHRNTNNLLGTTPVDPFTGQVSMLGNVGHVINKGLEVSLTSGNLQGKDFGWTTTVNFAYNKNKVIEFTKPSLYSNTATYEVGSTLVAGLPMQALFAYRFAGLDNMGDPQIYLHDGTITKQYDAAKAEDLKYMGTTVPVFNGGITNTFRYKGLSLTANMIYSFGNVMFRDVNQFYTGRLNAESFRTGNIAPSFLDRWKKPGDEQFTDVPSYVAAGKTNFTRRNTDYYTLADINVVSASYLKLRDITLSYSFSPGVIRALGVQSISVYTQASNFLVWTANNYHLDPEYQDLYSGNRNLPPFKHTYTLGLNFTL